MLWDLNITQRRALAVLTVIALLFGAYFLRRYLILIAVAAVIAYLFTPLYNRLRTRMNVGLSATLTLLAALLIVGIPLTGVIVLAVMQIGQMVSGISHWVATTDLTQLGQRLLTSANDVLARIPFMHINLTEDTVRNTIARIGRNLGEGALNFAQDSVGSLFSMLTAAIIFLYVFLALVVNGPKVRELFRGLNPLGEEVSDLYLAKIGAMVTASVRGQFIIAVCQGTAGAISIYLGGIHNGFFMFVIFLTALSFIPLGSGILTIPLGIGMALFGNVPGGVFVVLFHIIVTTNIDNVLRPLLVPRSAYLSPALMLLAVFAGLGMFGFWGIVLGPVLMIVIVTTISVYLAVYKGAPLDAHPTEDDEPRPKSRWPWQRIKPSAVSEEPEPPGTEEPEPVGPAAPDGPEPPRNP